MNPNLRLAGPVDGHAEERYAEITAHLHRFVVVGHSDVCLEGSFFAGILDSSILVFVLCCIVFQTMHKDKSNHTFVGLFGVFNPDDLGFVCTVGGLVDFTLRTSLGKRITRKIDAADVIRFLGKTCGGSQDSKR